MRIFFYRFWRNLYAVFSWPYIAAHLFAVALTYAAVTSGFDWRWYGYSRGIPAILIVPAVVLGGLLPIVVPLTAMAVGAARKDARIKRLAGLLGQSALMGWLVSSLYKSFTGRAHPTFEIALMRDISRDFQFGFLRGGIFWGWPSSHTTVAFAMTVALAVFYKERNSVKVPALLYALYVGLAVSISIHWFSDFLAGALIGTVIGLAVGRSFRAAQDSKRPS